MKDKLIKAMVAAEIVSLGGSDVQLAGTAEVEGDCWYCVPMTFILDNTRVELEVQYAEDTDEMNYFIMTTTDTTTGKQLRLDDNYPSLTSFIEMLN